MNQRSMIKILGVNLMSFLIILLASGSIQAYFGSLYGEYSFPYNSYGGYPFGGYPYSLGYSWNQPYGYNSWNQPSYGWNQSNYGYAWNQPYSGLYSGMYGLIGYGLYGGGLYGSNIIRTFPEGSLPGPDLSFSFWASYLPYYSPAPNSPYTICEGGGSGRCYDLITGEVFYQ